MNWCKPVLFNICVNFKKNNIQEVILCKRRLVIRS